MKPYGADCGIDGFHALSGEGCHHAGENIAAAAAGKSGVSRCISPELAVWRGDEGAVLLQHDDAVVFLGEAECDFLSVRLDISDAAAAESRHFAGVRRDDQLMTG